MEPDPETGTPATELVVTFDDGYGSTSRWTLSCDPAAGTHPRPEAACHALTEHAAEALPAVPLGRRCAQVHGGPQTATVSGTWRGQIVSSRFSRTNGCETARWDALEGLLPGAGS